MQTILIYNNNLNGFNGKKSSIAELLSVLTPTVTTFQETNMSGRNQIKIKKYFSFQRNRKGTKSMGGVATQVSNVIKAEAMKVTEGEGSDEYLLTLLGHVVPAVNILNVYGGIKSRMSRQEVLENWVNITKEIKKIKEKNEGLVLIGDFNRAIGSGKAGVKGNNPEVSYGGRMIRDLLEQEEE